MAPMEQTEYAMLRDGLQKIAEDIRDLKQALDLFRRDVAIGFVPRDLFALQIDNIRAQASLTEKAMITLQEHEEAHYNEIRQELKDQSTQAMSNRDRFWIRVGIFSGMVGVTISVITFIMNMHR